jgi:hypothetical protein
MKSKMGKVNITRRYSSPFDLTIEPSFINSGLSTTSFSFKIKNNDSSIAKIYWELENTKPKANNIQLNPNEESESITISNLIEGTSYTVYIYAIGTNKRKSEVVSLTRTPSPFQDGSSSQSAAPSTEYLIQGGVSTDGFYWIDVPVAGPTLVYCELSTDSKGWILMHCNDVNTPAGSSPPRDSVADFGRTSAFWQGDQGSNQSFTVGNSSLTTATTEVLIKRLPYKKIRFGGSSYGGAMVTVPADGAAYYAANPLDAVKIASIEVIAQNGNTTHAQKMTNKEPWTQGTNAKQTMVYDQTWNEGYNAGEFLVGFFRTSASAYGDFNHIYLGGRCDRRSLSSALWRNRFPTSGVSYNLHDNPTSIHHSLGSCGHRGGGNHANDSWWIQQE